MQAGRRGWGVSRVPAKHAELRGGAALAEAATRQVPEQGRTAGIFAGAHGTVLTAETGDNRLLAFALGRTARLINARPGKV